MHLRPDEANNWRPFRFTRNHTIKTLHTIIIIWCQLSATMVPYVVTDGVAKQAWGPSPFMHFRNPDDTNHDKVGASSGGAYT